MDATGLQPAFVVAVAEGKVAGTNPNPSTDARPLGLVVASVDARQPLPATGSDPHTQADA